MMRLDGYTVDYIEPAGGEEGGREGEREGTRGVFDLGVHDQGFLGGGGQ